MQFACGKPRPRRYILKKQEDKVEVAVAVVVVLLAAVKEDLAVIAFFQPLQDQNMAQESNDGSGASQMML